MGSIITTSRYTHDMAKRKRKNAPGAGRPPAGVGGARTSDYPKVRLPPTVLAELQAIADEREQPVWMVVTEAATQFLASTRKPKAVTR